MSGPSGIRTLIWRIKSPLFYRYDLMGKGDKISVEYSVLNNNWTDKAGQDHYDIVLRIDSVKLQESKSVTQARRETEKAKAK